MKQKLGEAGIIKNCKSGKIKHQEILYKHFYSYAMGICLRYAYTKTDASEILNDSFLKVFKGINSFSEELPFKPWLRTIIVNTAIDYYRKNTRFSHILEIEQAENEGFNIDAIDSLAYYDLKNILDELPEPYRLIFNLYEIEGYTHKEIAEKTELNESTSRSYLARAKKKLRILVENYFELKNERKIRT